MKPKEVEQVIKERDTANLSLALAHEALEKYGRHTASCLWKLFDQNCTCGYLEALSQLSPATAMLKQFEDMRKALEDIDNFKWSRTEAHSVTIQMQQIARTALKGKSDV